MFVFRFAMFHEMSGVFHYLLVSFALLKYSYLPYISNVKIKSPQDYSLGVLSWSLHFGVVM